MHHKKKNDLYSIYLDHKSDFLLVHMEQGKGFFTVQKGQRNSLSPAHSGNQRNGFSPVHSFMNIEWLLWERRAARQCYQALGTTCWTWQETNHKYSSSYSVMPKKKLMEICQLKILIFVYKKSRTKSHFRYMHIYVQIHISACIKCCIKMRTTKINTESQTRPSRHWVPTI